MFSLAKHKLKRHVFLSLVSLQDGQSNAMRDTQPETLNINMKMVIQADILMSEKN